MLNDIAYSGAPFADVKSARRLKSGVGTTRSFGPSPPSTISPPMTTTRSSVTLSAATRSCTRPLRSDERPLAWTGM